MSALQRKLQRDLVRLRGQVVTIALVVAAGISCFITLRGAFGSLVITHNMAIARMADRVIYFSDGKVVKLEENASKVSPRELTW